MAKKKRGGHAGGHGWFVTFADLMALLVAFFVMLVAFSTQDKQPSCRSSPARCAMPSACRTTIRYSGIIEVDGLPTRPQAQERRQDQAGGSVGDAEPRRERPQQQLRRAHRGRPRLRARLRVAAPGVAGHAGDRRSLEAHHDRGDQAGSQHRDRRSGRPLDVSGRLEGAVRAHAAPGAEAAPRSSRRCRTGLSIAGHTAASTHAGAAGLWPVGTVGRPRQCGAPDPRGGGRADRHTSSWWPAGPTRSRCSPTIPSSRPTAA